MGLGVGYGFEGGFGVGVDGLIVVVDGGGDVGDVDDVVGMIGREEGLESLSEEYRS